MSAHAVLWAKPSIARPGAETLVLRLPDNKSFRGYEQLENGEFEPLTHRFTLEQAEAVAAKLLCGDAQVYADGRAAVLVAAALLAVIGARPNPARDLEIPEPLKAGALV